MKTINAQNPGELLEQLSACDISVPARTEGITTEQCEAYSICRLLASITHLPLLHYPLQIERVDKPDFILSTPEINIGVEITEAIPQEYAQAAAIAEQKGYDGARLMPRIIPGGPKLSPQQIDQIASGVNPSPGWDGNEVETDWADAVALRLEEKVNKFTSSGYQKCNQNWLLIYETGHYLRLMKK